MRWEVVRGKRKSCFLFFLRWEKGNLKPISFSQLSFKSEWIMNSGVVFGVKVWCFSFFRCWRLFFDCFQWLFAMDRLLFFNSDSEWFSRAFCFFFFFQLFFFRRWSKTVFSGVTSSGFRFGFLVSGVWSSRRNQKNYPQLPPDGESTKTLGYHFFETTSGIP